MQPIAFTLTTSLPSLNPDVTKNEPFRVTIRNACVFVCCSRTVVLWSFVKVACGPGKTGERYRPPGVISRAPGPGALLFPPPRPAAERSHRRFFGGDVQGTRYQRAPVYSPSLRSERYLRCRVPARLRVTRQKRHMFINYIDWSTRSDRQRWW